MNSVRHLKVVALILAQILVATECGVYDDTDKWIISGKALEFPNDAVLGGFDADGFDNYVGRVYYSSSSAVLPARVVPEKGYANYNTESVANKIASYEVLVANQTVSYHWVRSYDGYRERNAVCVGTNGYNDRVYVCRALTDNGLFIGTLFLADRRCYIRLENMPLRTFDKYEMLVRKIKLA
ncbi:LOW QUALITY PROTEIN: uncharacterized protein LOC108598019 [Drosophila busckii]|uniref:LOW QUALITY PROTEIN: uncharacterized protein LOC108598019 n=1 Tax=Drosophila busckii TaxID=30019 RepID=UPI001432960E|nr:LOW QUALITY PROTEIN: uncharacterized protein LOC108598019 [Drosophila busckii]